MNIDITKLNPMERNIHEILPPLIKQQPGLKILEAAEFCNVSSSKISKYVKKLSFENFKQYKLHFSGQLPSQIEKGPSSELNRIKTFIDDFNTNNVDKFIETFQKYEKIVLFGLGPSYICMEYFAYKLSLISEKKVYTAQEEGTAEIWSDPRTIVFAFSVTGSFSSFDGLNEKVTNKGGTLALILEEYNKEVSKNIENIFYLTKSSQNPKLLPHEKTRTVFFIFIEEVISKLSL